jgi:hypothetical protein
VIGPEAVCISLNLFPNIDEGRILGQLFSDHNLSVRMVPYRPEEYEFVAYTMPSGSATKLEAVNLVFMFAFTFSNTVLAKIPFTYLIKTPLFLFGGQ